MKFTIDVEDNLKEYLGYILLWFYNPRGRKRRRKLARQIYQEICLFGLEPFSSDEEIHLTSSCHESAFFASFVANCTIQLHNLYWTSIQLTQGSPSSPFRNWTCFLTLSSNLGLSMASLLTSSSHTRQRRTWKQETHMKDIKSSIVLFKFYDGLEFYARQNTGYHFRYMESTTTAFNPSRHKLWILWFMI